MLLHAVTYTERITYRESYIALVDLYTKRNFPLSMARAAAQPRRCSIKCITFGFVRTRRIKDDVQWAITNQPKTHIHCIHRLETRSPLSPPSPPPAVLFEELKIMDHYYPNEATSCPLPSLCNSPYRRTREKSTLVSRLKRFNQRPKKAGYILAEN